MKIESQHATNWLMSVAIVLALLVVGQSLLVPLLFAILLWSVFNALAERLAHIGFPRWLAWFSSLIAIAAVLYIFARILGNEATAIAERGPAYVARLQVLVSGGLAFLHLGQTINLADLAKRVEITGILGEAAVSFGGLLFQITLIAVYIGFLLAEQRYLPAKIAKLTIAGPQRDEGKEVIETITRQVQSYLGVCTLLSAAMALVTYLVLTALGVEFAAFWALMMFLLTYIPTVGALGVLLPALMALVQFGSFEIFLVVTVVLGAVHFLLTSVIQTILLGRSLNLSPLAIILSLSFWGLIWGVAGLFLAVPLMAAIGIICAHIDGAHWVDVALAGPPLKSAKKKAEVQQTSSKAAHPKESS